MKLQRDLREFIELLNSKGVKYVIVGNKRASGRAKDLADVSELTNLERKR